MVVVDGGGPVWVVVWEWNDELFEVAVGNVEFGNVGSECGLSVVEQGLGRLFCGGASIAVGVDDLNCVVDSFLWRPFGEPLLESGEVL